MRWRDAEQRAAALIRRGGFRRLAAVLYCGTDAVTMLAPLSRVSRMVTISVDGPDLVLEVQGFDKLWALRSRLQIPLAHIRSVQPAVEPAKRWFHGIKVAGSAIPGVLTAGTFYQDGGLVFWDVHEPANAIAFELADERYQRLVVEVEDPTAAIRMVESHMTRARR